MARSVHTRHLRAHSRSELWLQSCGRSQRARSPASFAQPNVRLERQPASNGPDRSSSFREGRGAEQPSPAPRHAPASVIPVSGNWRSCPMPKHIAPRHRPSACLSSVLQCRRSPYRIVAADKPVGLDEQFCFQRSRVPDTSRNKMVQLIIVPRRKSLGHWLNALAITRADQPSHIKRTHPLPRLVTQTLQERLEPSPKLAFPTCPRARHGRPSIKPTTHESLKI